MTANGERYHKKKFSAAHLTLPLGTWVEITSKATGKRIRLRVNDRGPYVHKFVIDLSRSAAHDAQVGNVPWRHPICLPSCAAAADCRPGFVCRELPVLAAGAVTGGGGVVMLATPSLHYRGIIRQNELPSPGPDSTVIDPPCPSMTRFAR